jgi:hypothetical protein
LRDAYAHDERRRRGEPEGRLSPNNFYGAQLHERVAYHEFEGITVELEEERLVRSIGNKRAVILRNHRLLS